MLRFKVLLIHWWGRGSLDFVHYVLQGFTAGAPELSTHEHLPRMAIKWVSLRLANIPRLMIAQLPHPAVAARKSGAYLVADPALNLRLTHKTFQRLAKWFTTLSPKDKAKIIKDVSQLVLSRRTRMCNFLEYKGSFQFSQQ